jgi:hypothetical protein
VRELGETDNRTVTVGAIVECEIRLCSSRWGVFYVELMLAALIVGLDNLVMVA